jgi:hypothetical protein
MGSPCHLSVSELERPQHVSTAGAVSFGHSQMRNRPLLNGAVIGLVMDLSGFKNA